MIFARPWHNPFLDDSCPNILALANKVNGFFVSLTDHFTPINPPVFMPQKVPPDFLVSDAEVERA